MAGFWKNDQKLEHDLKKYVAARLDCVRKDYSAYKWSLRTLGRRLRHFGIHYIDSNTPLEVAREAVKKELDGPGAMLGYRAMTLKIQQKYDVKVPRALVYDFMSRSWQDLQEVAELSGVLDAPDDFLSTELHALLSVISPEAEKTQCN